MNVSSNLNSLKSVLGGRNIYLIGMMGSGKSLTGPSLAKRLEYSFVDLDVVLEKATGKLIQVIFEEDGETNFRQLEKQVLTATGQRHSLVVATGGGVVTLSANWGVLHQGIVIWLDPGRDRLLARLRKDTIKRPLLETKDPEKVFDQIFATRAQLYAEADLHISVQDESAEQVAQNIIDQLPSILSL